MERRLVSFLSKRGLGGVSVLIAFSGGSDSTALLLAASAAAPALNLRVRAAWVDHGIRPDEERTRERSFVRGLTARLGIPCRIVEPPVEPLSSRAGRLKSSLEAEARDFRYSALLEAAAEAGCERILTAHTRDDQAETLLARVLSGSGTAGLRGIPEDRPPFLRPFLTLPKAALVRYLRDRGQDWVEDSTNAGEDYLRNRVRRRLIPAAEEVFPGFRKALSALSEKSRMDEDYLSLQYRKELPALRSEGWSSFDARAFRAAHPALRIRALTEEAARFAGRGRRVPYAMVRTAALGDPGTSGSGVIRILARSMGLRIYEADGRICVAPDPGSDGAPGAPALRSAEPRAVTFASGYSFLFERPDTLRIDTATACTVYFRAGSAGPAKGTFEFPLAVRSRLPGDWIGIRGGRKPVDEILAEWKVPPPWRERIPVLEDPRGILGILGSAAGFRDRFRPGPDAVDPSVPRLVVEIEGIAPSDQ